MSEAEPDAPWALPTSTVTRQHSPSAGQGDSGWRAFKPCLRWEFDFTCIYCRLRESDFGHWSQSRFAVEHLWPRRHFPERAKDYGNCYYACVSCNSSKGATYPSPEEEAQGYRFFDPCRDVATEHFALVGDTIAAARGSMIAQYTLDEVRNINREIPTKRRRRRILGRIRELRELRTRVVEASGIEQELCERFLGQIDKWLNEVYTPTDSPAPCSCGLVSADLPGD